MKVLGVSQTFCSFIFVSSPQLTFTQYFVQAQNLRRCIKQQHVTTVFQVAVRNKNTLVVFSDPPRDTYHGLKYAQCRALFQQDYKDSLLKTNQDVPCGPLLRDEQSECLVSTPKYGSVPRFIKTVGPGCPSGKVVNSWLQPNSRKLRGKALNGVLIRRKK